MDRKEDQPRNTEHDVRLQLGGEESKLRFNRQIFGGNLLLALQGRHPKEDTIDSNHFYLAADALQRGDREEFKTRLGYIAQEYHGLEDYGIQPAPEGFYQCFRELAVLGGEDFDAIEAEACRPMSREEALTKLADLAEPLPNNSSIRKWAEDEQLKVLFSSDNG
jgi:hypothetical protein